MSLSNPDNGGTQQFPSFRPDDFLRAGVGIVLMVMVGAGIARFVAGVDALQYLPEYPFCPFRAITGLQCPGCGMTRAMLLIGQLRFRPAAHLNPLSFPLTLAMVIYVSRGKVWSRPLSPVIKWGMVVGVIAFWGIRLVS